MKKSIAIILLIIPFLLLSEKKQIQGHWVPGIKPTVDGATINFYKRDNQKKIKKTIIKNLESSYESAWETYFTLKNNLPACVVNAMDNLHTKVPEINLTFTFFSAAEYFEKRGLKGKLTGEKTVRNSNGKIIDYGGDIGGGGGAVSSTSILLGDAYQPFPEFNKFTTKSGECDLQYYLSEFDIDSTDNLFLKEWQKQAEVGKNTLAGIIFHELVHIALKVVVQSNRYGDEATVEDIQLKIFPDAIPLYKNFYDRFLWKYIKKGEKLAFWYMDGNWQRRWFNPPDGTGLQYQAKKDEINIITQGRNPIRISSAVSYSNGPQSERSQLPPVQIVTVTHQEATDCQDALCEPMKDYIIPYLCKCDPKAKCAPEPPAGGSGGNSGGPGGDYPDDNYSFSSGIVHEFNLFPEAVVLTQGYWQEALKLYGGLKAEPEFTANALFESTPFLIVPTGSLFGMENDATFKIILQEYVRQGGCIIVFDQQLGSHIDKVVPIPEGESLHSYGWRQDQSCYNGSVYFKTMHPALSGLYNERPSAGLDGFISVYPANATVLLRKSINQDPVLLYYPYGNGTVILTTLYTDYGHAHSQASWEELRLIRDLVTFAKNPNLAIPMFNLAVNPSPRVALNVRMKNSSEAGAAKARLKVFTPSRSKVLYESEQSIALNAGDEGEVHIEFDLSGITSKDYGICHADYELYDAEGSLVQPYTESDGGRFAA